MAKKPVHDDRYNLPTDRLSIIGVIPLRPTICFAVIIQDSSIIDFCAGNRVYRIVTGVYSRTVYTVYEKMDCAVVGKNCV